MYILVAILQQQYHCCLSPTYSLAQRPTLSNCDLITLLHTECRADGSRQVLVAFLVTGVFGDEVEVLAADDQGAVHLGGNDGTGEDTAADGDEASEGALFVCGVTLLVWIPYSYLIAPFLQVFLSTC